MNLTIFPFNFYFKITPLCPWYQSKKKNNSTPVITIVGVPFTAMHINRKWAFYSFNIPWRYQICIAKCIYSYRDDLPQNLFKITAQEYKKSTVLLTCVDQKRRCFKGLPKMMAGNGIYSPPMKIISNTILFVYSLRGALIKIARVCHMRWRNYFDGTNPISCLQGVRHAFLPYSCRAGTRDTNVCVGGYGRLPHFWKSSEGIQLRFSYPDYRKHFTFQIVFRFMSMREPYFALT